MPASSSSSAIRSKVQTPGIARQADLSRGSDQYRQSVILYTIRLIVLNRSIWPMTVGTRCYFASVNCASEGSPGVRHTMVFHETCSLVPGTRPDDSSPPPRRARASETARARPSTSAEPPSRLYQIPIPRLILSIRRGVGRNGKLKKAASPRSVRGVRLLEKLGTMEIPIQYVC